MILLKESLIGFACGLVTHLVSWVFNYFGGFSIELRQLFQALVSILVPCVNDHHIGRKYLFKTRSMSISYMITVSTLLILF